MIENAETDYRAYFSLFLKNLPEGIKDYRAHSHHYWPDCTRQAQIKYWDLAAQYKDDKWEYFFEEFIPSLQKKLLPFFGLSPEYASQVIFGSNTFELIFKLLSTFSWNSSRPLRILTTQGEFYSFQTLIESLSSHFPHFFNIKKVKNFQEFQEEVQAFSPDFCLISHVFFKTGYALSSKDLDLLHQMAIKFSSTLFVIDVYHSFLALDFSWDWYKETLAFCGGSYKYVGGGEGAAFLFLPKKWEEKTPFYRGWISDFFSSPSSLTTPPLWTKYLGATEDLTPFFRLESVLDWREQIGLTVAKGHYLVSLIQEKFLQHYSERDFLELDINKGTLLLHSKEHRAHFFSFYFKEESYANFYHALWEKKGILTDRRKNYIRFGFSFYNDYF